MKLSHVIGETLGALTDRAIINRVATEGIHAASSATGAKRNDRPEYVVEILPAPITYMLQDRGAVIAIPVFGQPCREILHCRGRDFSLRKGL